MRLPLAQVTTGAGPLATENAVVRNLFTEACDRVQNTCDNTVRNTIVGFASAYLVLRRYNRGISRLANLHVRFVRTLRRARAYANT